MPCTRHPTPPVDLGGDGLDLLIDSHVERIEELEIRLLLARLTAAAARSVQP
ncbi:MAG: hypothetical protein GY720_16465 [bacterium]|nr:hypothetical protein [bacterium]